MEKAELIYDKVNEGWQCSCGAFYEQPENWKPICCYCMRCKRNWENLKGEN